MVWVVVTVKLGEVDSVGGDKVVHMRAKEGIPGDVQEVGADWYLMSSSRVKPSACFAKVRSQSYKVGEMLKSLVVYTTGLVNVA